MSIVGLPVTLLAGIGIIKFGPSKLYIFAYSLMMLCLGGFFAVYQIPALNTVSTLVILAGLYQVGRSVLEFTPWNVFPFIPDIDEMVSHQRREGLFAAVMTFARKTTVAVATFIVGLLLQKWRFREGESNPAAGSDSYHRHAVVYRHGRAVDPGPVAGTDVPP